ncbi:RRQRL motif-containing zinc-binding protein [Streptomyces alboflavus]|uniref:RRQRL motif-containing zinc-binding protein n=1 Tax=Streptomyces alboflavus TaxID=67267 RepID=UPI0036C24153
MGAAYAKCYDPTGARYGIPTYPWKYAPDGLATRRQLRARGLRPGGQPIAAQLMLRHRGRKSGALVAYLYRVDLALPVRPMTSRKWGALALAMLARRTCPACCLDVGYCIPRSHGICGACITAQEQSAA